MASAGGGDARHSEAADSTAGREGGGEADAEQGGAAGTSLTRRIMAAHTSVRNKPSAPKSKEVQESLAFVRRCTPLMRKEKRVVVDVCSGHGMIGMLFLAFKRAKHALVLDIKARKATALMHEAWRDFIPENAVGVREGDLRDTLPEVLATHDPSAVLVVACHACAHLTDVVLETAAAYNVDVAVMPCCHRDGAADVDRGNIARAAKSIGTSLGNAMDLCRMGRMQSQGYDVRWREIDVSITPQNHMLICLAGQRRPEAHQRRRRDAPSGY